MDANDDWQWMPTTVGKIRWLGEIYIAPVVPIRQASLKVAWRSVRATFTTFKNLETPLLGSGPFSDPGFGRRNLRISGFNFFNILVACPCSIAMTAISKEAKRKGLFQDSYTIDYTLKITKHHTHTRQVLSARCPFCIYIEREQNSFEEHVRQPTINSKDFKLIYSNSSWKNTTTIRHSRLIERLSMENSLHCEISVGELRWCSSIWHLWSQTSRYWGGKRMNIIYHWRICHWKRSCSPNSTNCWNRWFDVRLMLGL